MADLENCFWNVDMEVSLFHAMRRHKPVGVNRYFQMICIHDKLNNASSRKITSSQIWKHLGEMYDLQALNESEIVPFPNRQTDFLLPETDFQSLIEKPYPRADVSSSSSEKVEGKVSKTEGKTSGTGSERAKADTKSSSKSDSKSTSTHSKEGKSTSTPKDKSEGKGGRESKSDSKGASTPHVKDVKQDGKGTSTPHGGKGGKTSVSQSGSAASTPESTPKRKRTRQTNSTNASPATPSEAQPVKRGRR